MSSHTILCCISVPIDFMYMRSCSWFSHTSRIIILLGNSHLCGSLLFSKKCTQCGLSYPRQWYKFSITTYPKWWALPWRYTQMYSVLSDLLCILTRVCWISAFHLVLVVACYWAMMNEYTECGVSYPAQWYNIYIYIYIKWWAPPWWYTQLCSFSVTCYNSNSVHSLDS